MLERDKMNLLGKYDRDGLFIYGAGITGCALYEVLKEKGICIQGFIVSDGMESKRFLDCPIYTFSIWKKMFCESEYLIVIALTSPYQNEVIRLLENNGITRWIVMNEEDFVPSPITILDTTLCDDNIGNQIIMQSIHGCLEKIYKSEFFYRVPYRDDLGKHALNCIKESKYVFMGGTNVLRSDMENEVTWGINRKNSKIIKNKVILMGVGWWQYQISEVNNYTYELLHEVLNEQEIHSVRDNYTMNRLRTIGIENVLNTGCPSIWGLDEKFCKKIPMNKSDEVLMMVTPNNRERDKYVLDILKRNYRKVHCWIQSAYDYKYLISLGMMTNIIPPRLEALERFLKDNPNVEYVGTRLHGGIKCLQYGRRAIIIGIDNRAKEMGKNFLLPVIDEKELSSLENKIKHPVPIMLKLPDNEIKIWIKQFARGE